MIDVKAKLTQRDIEAYFEAERELKEVRYGLTPEVSTRALMLFHKAATENKTSDRRYAVLAAEFMQALMASKRAADLAPPIINGISIRAAVKAGLITGIDGDVGDLRPYEVTRLTRQLGEAIQDSYDVPKN